MHLRLPQFRRLRLQNIDYVTPLQKVGIGFFLVLTLLSVYTYTRAALPTRVQAATASHLNFQGRLQGNTGALVSDGTYSIEFKLYESSGGGVSIWDETQNVTVKNGYFSVGLGSSSAFPGTIDWSQEKWLTLNVNGDGEMTPRIKLTAVPYAFRAGQADSLTITGGNVSGDNLLQKAPGAVQAITGSNAGLRMNQTGTGGLVELQGDGSTVFSVDKQGNTNLAGSLQIGAGLILGNSSATTAGNLRWTGTDFEGYDGSGWVSLTATGGGSGGSAFVNGGNSFSGTATIGTNDSNNLNFETGGSAQLSLDTSGNLDLLNGALETGGTTRIANNGALQNVTADTGILTSGTLGVSRGGTGAGSFTTNGLLFGNNTGAIGVTTAGTGGQLLIANGSGTPTFVTLGGDGSLTDSGVLTIANGAISNNKLVNSAFNLSYGTNLSGDASVSLGGTLNLSLSANPSFTTVTSSGAITAATSTDTINGLIINSGSLSGITGFAQTSGNFSISGTGSIALGGGSNALTINSTNFDVDSAGALSGITSLNASGAITAATATNTINGLVVNSGSLSSITGFTQASGNFAISGSGSFGTGSGNVSLNGATTITTNTNSATALTVNGTTGTAADALRIAQTGNAANLVMTNTARTSGALISMTQNTSAFTGTGLLFNFASGSGSFASGNFLDFQLNGTSRFKIDNTGALQISSDSATALQVRSSNGSLSYLTVNNTGNLVQIGSATTDATAILSVLDSYNNATDPTGVNGASYYNTARNISRCYENNYWSDCQATRVQDDVTLASPASSISVSLVGTETNLVCRLSTSGRSASGLIYARFNNVSSAGAYSYNVLQNLTGANNNTTAQSSGSATELRLNGSGTGTNPGIYTLNVNNFATANKSVDWTGAGSDASGSAPNNFKGAGTYFNNTTQITSVQFISSAGNFNAGTRAWCEAR
jgi:hypothetical protein